MSQELTEVQQKQVTVGLMPKLTERQELVNSYNTVIKLPMNEENAKQFRELRLLLVKNRKEIEKWKTLEKAFYLVGGKFIQAIYNKEVTVNQDMEAKLLEGEQYAIRMEAERLEKIRSERWEKLQKFVEVEPVGLSTMEQSMFEALLLGSETTYKNRIEAEKKAELERLEVVRLDKLERDRIDTIAPLKDFAECQIDLRNSSDVDFNNYLDAAATNKAKHKAKQKAIQEENERLKKEAEAEKAKQESILKKERDENNRLQAELQAKQDAENKAKAEAERIAEVERVEAENKAKAPIKEQLTSWVDSFELPPLTTPNDKALEIIQKFKSYKKWAKTEIEKI